MSVQARTTVTQLVTQHLLLITDAGADGAVLSADGAALVSVGPGSLALLSAGSEMDATVTIEHHDAQPTSRPGVDWDLVAEESVDLPTGNLTVGNTEGSLERVSSLGLSAGRWQTRVYVTGQLEAEILEDHLIEELEVSYEVGYAGNLSRVVTGPERWLIQFWPSAR